MSGFRVDVNSTTGCGKTLLMRTLPLVTNPVREGLYGGSIYFKHINNQILDALIVSAADGTADSVYRGEMPIALECMFSWCVKTLRSSHTWGTYSEAVEDTFFNTTKAEYPWSTIDRPEQEATDTYYHGNITLYPADSTLAGPGFGLSNDTHVSAVSCVDEIFPSLMAIQNPTAEPFLKVRTSFRDRVVYRLVRFSPWLAPNNVTHHMERMTLALTDVIRSDSASNEAVKGKAYAPETYIVVHWAWLTFPLAMLGLCVIFLVATIVKTSGNAGGEIRAWKTSAMPTLIYSLPQDARHQLAGLKGDRAANGGKSKVKIRLKPDEGWRMSGQLQTSPAPC